MKGNAKKIICLAICALLVLPLGGCGKKKAEASSASPEETGIYHIEIEVKGYDPITAELDANAAPETVAHFLSLVEEKFYHKLTFHRMAEGFVLQGGDPEGTGYGGSGTTVVGEFAENGHENPISHTRGTISMARAEDFDSASSQFFICLGDASASLDGLYAAFGRIDEDGMAIVDQICEGLEPTDEFGTLDPEAQPVIKSIKRVD